MNKKLVITKYGDKILSGLFEDYEMIQVNLEPIHPDTKIGNIYVGKVKNIVKNISAAFVEIENGIICYMPLKEEKAPLFCVRKKDNSIRIGDELLVQVVSENIKTKAPVVTTNLSFTGKYTILTHGRTEVGVSTKIQGDAEKRRLKAILMQYQNPNYGFIVRTNAKHIDTKKIDWELQILRAQYEEVRTFGIHKYRFSLVRNAPESYICDIRDGLSDELEEIITDDLEVYRKVKEYLSLYQKEDLLKLHLYQDNFISLNNLYSIREQIKKALLEKIWLKSGGYLVIQPTEALTVIDINTGKAVRGKKEAQETFFRINCEAAIEITKQLRLRNISGIIIIDFIDMISKERRQKLIQLLKENICIDPIKTIFVDMTALNLVELTRKRSRKPLYEQVRE